MAVQFNKNLGIRVISGLLALPIVFGALFTGGIWYLLFVLLGCGLLIREWSHLTQVNSFPLMLLSFVLSVAVLGAVYSIAVQQEDSRLMTMLVLASVGGGFCLLFLSLFLKESSSDFLWSIVGVGYMAVIGVSMLWLPFLSVTLVVWLLFVVWATDVGGYFAGKSIGGPKLAPVISPKKTWAGAVGGVLLAVFISFVITYLTGWWEPLPAAGTAVLLSVVSQVGDLYESILKRRFHVKDSGGIIPGHGGLLDRIDGLSFAAGATALVCAVFLSP